MAQRTFLAAGEPAAGAPAAELMVAAAAGVLVTAALVGFAALTRSGRLSALPRMAGWSARLAGLPPWAALPAVIAGASLVLTVFGFYWDVATHIDDGRDAGLFANQSHFLILLGIGGIVFAGIATVLLGPSEPTPASVRLRDGWHAPLGGLMIIVSGSFALLGFPLDELWHRLFGQDVTLWSPTHILMISGAGFSTLGLWVLLSEARERREGILRGRAATLFRRTRGAGLAGGFLTGLSALQLEFDYGVPQFSLLYHPVILMLAAGVALVAARVKLGPTGALQGVAFFLVLHGAIALIVGPGFGHTTMHFPLYLAEAVLVELVALRVRPDRPLPFGAAAGAAIGTLGLAAEWGWSHLWMPIPWPASMAPEAAALGLVAGVAGGVLGGFVGQALLAPRARLDPGPRWLAPVAVAAAVAVLAYPLAESPGEPVTARVALQDLGGPGGREVAATIALDPPAAARAARWLSVLAWQGGGSRLEHLAELSPGVYRTGPVPVHGEWKAMVRLHRGRSFEALPIYMPEDAAIPAPEIAAPARFERRFVPDSQIVQREATGDNDGLVLPAYLVMLAVVATWLAALGWGLVRMRGCPPSRPSGGPPPRVSGRALAAG